MIRQTKSLINGSVVHGSQSIRLFIGKNGDFLLRRTRVNEFRSRIAPQVETLSVGCGVRVGAGVGAVVVGAAADAWAVGRVGRVGAVRVRAAPVAVARAGHAGRTGPRGRAGRAGHAGRRAQRRGRLAERAPLARLARRRPVCWEREKDRVGLVRTRDSGWGAAGD